MYVTCLQTGKVNGAMGNTRSEQVQLVSPGFPLCSAPCSPCQAWLLLPGMAAPHWLHHHPPPRCQHHRMSAGPSSHHPLMSWPSALHSRVHILQHFTDLLHGPAFRFILKHQLGHDYFVLVKIKCKRYFNIELDVLSLNLSSVRNKMILR